MMGKGGAMGAALTTILCLRHGPVHNIEHCVKKGQILRGRRELPAAFKENEENMMLKKYPGWYKNNILQVLNQ